jgi:hypothetical protein
MSYDESTKERKLVPIFVGVNHAQWSRRMGNYLIENDLDDVVGFDIDTFEPATEQPDVTAAAKKRRDRKSKAAIEQFVHDQVLGLIVSCKTSHEVWTLLKSTYQRSTMSATVAALKLFVKLEKSPKQTMQSYISATHEAAHRVASAGHTFPEGLIVAKILAGLPPDYDDVTKALDTHDTVTMMKATQTLLNAEISKLASSISLPVGDETANAITAINAWLDKLMLHRVKYSDQDQCGTEGLRRACGGAGFRRGTIIEGGE